MGKSMARIQNGVVTNIEWVGDRTVETPELKNTYDLHIRIGDTYTNGSFYRNGDRILSFRERVRNTVVNYSVALTEIELFIPSMFSVINDENSTLEDRKIAIVSYLTELINISNEREDD